MAEAQVDTIMNLEAVKLLDPYVKRILSSATRVLVYSFCMQNNDWVKTEVEGALFLCTRNGKPDHSIIIKNQLNVNSIVEPLIHNFDWVMRVPHLLYRNSSNRIYGIYFSNSEECVRVTDFLQAIMEKLWSQPDRVYLNGPATEDRNLLTLLDRAENQLNSTMHQSRLPDYTPPPEDLVQFFAHGHLRGIEYSNVSREQPAIDDKPPYPQHLLNRLPATNPIRCNNTRTMRQWYPTFRTNRPCLENQFARIPSPVTTSPNQYYIYPHINEVYPLYSAPYVPYPLYSAPYVPCPLYSAPYVPYPLYSAPYVPYPLYSCPYVPYPLYSSPYAPYPPILIPPITFIIPTPIPITSHGYNPYAMSSFQAPNCLQRQGIFQNVVYSFRSDSQLVDTVRNAYAQSSTGYIP